MSNRANPTLIGAFVLGAVALAVAGVLILGGWNWFSRPQPYVMFFDGSVAGLSVGSPVQYRGVPLGAVTDIRAVAGGQQIAVFVALDVNRHQFLGAGEGRLSAEDVSAAVQGAIARGMRAQLQNQSLVTGQLYVGLDYFRHIPVRLTGLDPDVPEIPTVPTTVEQASEQLKRLVARVETLPVERLFTTTVETVDALRTLVQSPELREAVRGLDTAVNDAAALVRRIDRQVEPIALSARETLDEARTSIGELNRSIGGLAQSLDQQMRPFLANTNETIEVSRALMGDTQRLVAETTAALAPLAASATRTVDAARVTLEKAQAALDNMDGVLTEESPLGYELARTLEELSDAARSLRSLAGSLERQPSSLLFGRRPAASR